MKINFRLHSDSSHLIAPAGEFSAKVEVSELSSNLFSVVLDGTGRFENGSKEIWFRGADSQQAVRAAVSRRINSHLVPIF